MLLYKDGNFMQVLEGDAAQITDVHRGIAADPRHRGLITLPHGTLPDRLFAQWSMGFRDLGADIDTLKGYSEFLDVPLTGREFQDHPGRAQKLLLSFKKSMVADRD